MVDKIKYMNYKDITSLFVYAVRKLLKMSVCKKFMRSCGWGCKTKF